MKEVLKLEDILIYGRIVGKIEDEEDYPSTGDTNDGEGYSGADPDLELWWLGDPRTEPGYSLSHGIADWFLHGKPYPLVRTRTQCRSALYDALNTYITPSFGDGGDDDTDADDLGYDSNEDFEDDDNHHDAAKTTRMPR